MLWNVAVVGSFANSFLIKSLSALVNGIGLFVRSVAFAVVADIFENFEDSV